MAFQHRDYRDTVQKTGMTAYRVVVKETDLHIQTDINLSAYARERVLYHRDVLEGYSARHPDFVHAMTPWMVNDVRPVMIEEMVQAGRGAGVGPMAAVAGVIAGSVGEDLMTRSKEVIVENGGDVFLKTTDPVTIGLYAGEGTFGSRLALCAGGDDMPVGVCTSSGTIGHSHSYGHADAVCVIARSCALADAAATAIGNQVQGEGDIRDAIEWGRNIPEIQGILVVVGEKIGAWGAVELVPARGG